MKDENSVLISCLRLAIPTAMEVQLITGFQHFELNLYPSILCTFKTLFFNHENA